nr:MAG TPA: hypothetical protein [Caudoviricetes sp.]
MCIMSHLFTKKKNSKPLVCDTSEAFSFTFHCVSIHFLYICKKY